MPYLTETEHQNATLKSVKDSETIAELLEALEKVTNNLEERLYDDAVETWATKDVAQKYAAALVQEYRDIIAKGQQS